MKKIILTLVLLSSLSFAEGWTLDFGLGVEYFPRTCTTSFEDQLMIETIGGICGSFATSYSSNDFGFSADIRLAQSGGEGKVWKEIERYYSMNRDVDSSINLNFKYANIMGLYFSPKVSLRIITIDPSFYISLFAGYSYTLHAVTLKAYNNWNAVNVLDYSENFSCAELVTELVYDHKEGSLRLQLGIQDDLESDNFSYPLTFKMNFNELLIELGVVLREDAIDYRLMFGIHVANQ
jgi:hypothetical protein